MIIFVLRLLVDLLDMINNVIFVRRDNVPVLKYKRVTDNAFAPIKADSASAGFDLKSAYHHVILPTGRSTVIQTDLQIDIPDGCYGRIASRSSLSVLNNIHVIAGVIDRNYRGNISVCVINLSNDSYRVQKGEKIGQLILEKIAYANIIEVDQLSETERGDKAFGSSGKF